MNGHRRDDDEEGGERSRSAIARGLRIYARRRRGWMKCLARWGRARVSL